MAKGLSISTVARQNHSPKGRSERRLVASRLFTAYLSWTNIQHTCEPVNQSQPCRVDSTYIGEKHAFRVRLNANF